MKESIHTIPLTDAFKAEDECPFCYLEREAEQHAVSFILGSAYMEDDIRAKTDATGFCRHHYKMMYDYGNRLGSAWILSTHLKKINEELHKEISNFTPENLLLPTALKRQTHPQKQILRLAHGWKNVSPPAMYATISDLFMTGIWTLFLICIKRMMNLENFSEKAKAFACRISVI